MSKSLNSSFGNFVLGYLSQMEWSMADLSRAMDMSPKQISIVLNGKEKPSHRFLEKITKAIPGTSLQMWEEVSAFFRKQDEEELRPIEGYKEWSDAFSFSKLFKGRELSKRQMLERVQEIYGTKDLSEAMHPKVQLNSIASFSIDDSKRGNVNRAYLEAWLRLSVSYDCVNDDNQDRTMVDRETVKTKLNAFKPMMKLTSPHDVLYSIIRFCNDIGVYFCFSPNAPTTYVSGAMMRLDQKHYIILTDRFKTAEMLYFSFVHEVFHIINGDDERDDVAFFSESNHEDFIDGEALGFFVDEKSLPSGDDSISNSKILDLATKNNISYGMAVLVLQKRGIIDYASNRNALHKFSYELATA